MNRIYYVNEFIFITCYSNVYTPLYAALTTGMRVNFPLGPALVKLEDNESGSFRPT
jgi:hypothetical protein